MRNPLTPFGTMALLYGLLILTVFTAWAVHVFGL